MKKITFLWVMLLLFGLTLSMKAQNSSKGLQFYNDYKAAVDNKTAIINADPVLYQEAVSNGWFDNVAIGLQNAQNYRDGIKMPSVSRIMTAIGGGGATCDNMDPFCTAAGSTYPAGVNTGTAESGPAYGCLGSEPNPVWYYMKILTGGDLHITESNSNNIDVDFILWGPFSGTTGVCSQLTSGKIVDCSYSSQATEYIDVASCQTGEYYILLVTNYSNNATNITLAKTGGSAETDCSITHPAPDAPVATPATSVTTTGFTANWNSSATATGYYLDVATDNGFTSFVSGYNNLDVSNVTTYPVSGLTGGTYYYRIRAYNTYGTSGNSNIITVAPNNIPCGSTITINAPTFANVGSALQLNGNAVITGSQTLELTTASNTEAGSAYWTSRLNFDSQYNFSTFFTAKFSNGSNPPADGIAFVIQNNTASALSTGGGLGYDGITPSLVVEFDSYYNGGWDPDANHIAIVENGDSHQMTNYADPPFTMSSVHSFNVWIEYNGAIQTLEVRASTSNIRPALPLVSRVIDMHALFGNANLYAGLSGSTGGSYEQQEILSWLLDNVYNSTGIDNNCTYLSAASNVAVTPTPASIFLNETSNVTVHATLPDGTNATNTTINFTGTNGTFNPTSAITNASGNASSVFTPTSTGTANITAIATGGATGTNTIIIDAPVATAETSVTATSFSANWNVTLPATGYYLDLATDNGFTNFVSSYNNFNVGNVTTYSITGLNPGTVYYYRIRAYNTVSTSDNSNVITAWTAPVAPVATQGTSFTPNSFYANWNSCPSATGYDLDVATDNGFTNFVSGYNNLDVGNVTTYQVTGVPNNITYYYRVRAYNNGGPSVNSNIIATVPPPPVATAATNETLHSFDANWLPSATATGYLLDVATDSLFAFIIPAYNNLNTGNVTTYTVTGLTTNTPYYYRLRAYNLAGTSVNSNVIMVRRCPIIVWPNPADITYGTPLSGTQLNANANIPGVYVYSPVSGTVLNAGANQNLTVTFTPTDIVLYHPTSLTVQITVLGANPVITWSNPADIVYGTALGGTQLNATTTIPGVWAYSPAGGTVLPAGANQILSVTFTPTDGVNYNVVSLMVHINVTRANPIITWNNPADIIYGTPLGIAQLDATADVPGAFAYTPTNGVVLNAGLNQSLSVTFTPADGIDYNTVSLVVYINVLHANPVITWNDPSDIIYGTPLNGIQLDATASVPGTFVYAPPAGTILPAGDNYITVTFTPTNGSDYNVVTYTVPIFVDRADPVITWANPVDIVYGTALSAVQLDAAANVPGTFAYYPSIGVVLPAGLNQSLSATFTPNDVANYNTVIMAVHINVLRAAPIITWLNPEDIIYGTALGADQLNATANTPGIFVYTPPAGTTLDAGLNQILSTTFTATDTTNYHPVTVTVLINVLRADPSDPNNPLIAWANPADIVYLTPLGTAQLNATNAIPGTFVYTPPAGTVLNAGPNQILTANFTPTDVANYLPATLTVLINVVRATLTITWANPTDISYGTSLGTLQLNATTTIPGSWDYSPQAGTVLPVGNNHDLSVTFTPTDISNYNLMYKMVQINVVKANPNITWENPADIAFGMSLGATQLNATTDIQGTFVYTPAAGTILNPGLNQSLSVTFTPFDEDNYNVAIKTVQINVMNAAPGSQAEITDFKSVHGIDFTVDWSRGDGAYCTVFIARADAGTPAPNLNTNYTANSEFKTGDQIDFTGWYCVYDGIGTTVKVTGLTDSTIYRVMVVEYNEWNGYKNYNTTVNAKDPLNVETLDPIGGEQVNYYISPNGDGINDYWVVDRNEEMQNYNLYIFNNIGETLYQSLGYDNKWNATYNNKELPSGTYYYLFKKGGDIIVKGYITVVR